MADGGIGAFKGTPMNPYHSRIKARASLAVLVVVLTFALATMQVERSSSAACTVFVGAALFGVSRLAGGPDWKALLDRAVECTPVGLCLFDTHSRLIISNQQFAALYGLTEAQVRPGTAFREILALRSERIASPESAAEDVGACASEVSPASAVQSFHELADGRIILVSRRLMSGGGFVEIHRDVTDERAAEERADRAMQALIERQYAIDQAVIVAITDLKGTITYANDNFCMISGYSREELIGQNHRILKSSVHPTELFRDMYRCLAKGQVWRGELCNRSKSGKLYWVDTVITPQLGSNGKPVSYMAIRIDITARKQAEAQISFAATHDSLTRLLNRSALLDELKAGPPRAGRGSGRFSMHLLDLDGFKAVNDTLGHNAGDHLLKQVALRLQSLAGGADLVARLGGDEFAIVRRIDFAVEEASLRFSRLIVEALAEPFEINSNQVNISASVGIALCPEHGTSPEDLLKKADLALYAAKASGRNGYRIYEPPMLKAVEEEKALKAELREALAQGQFELHYQPIVDAQTRSMVAAEALVRWRHPQHGLILPADFIPVAEHTGQILPLGEWIIQQACHHAASWPTDIRVAVNVSAIQFKRGNLFEAVTEALLRSGLSPRRLEIEVTETALLEQQSEQLRTFRQLKNMGVVLALDDFGTGYSSASYLTKFPFDRIKIDRSLVQCFDKRRECAAVIASAVALAKGLEITITAEGIETTAQFEVLRSIGIDFMQGYLFGRPVPHPAVNPAETGCRHFLELLPAEAAGEADSSRRMMTGGQSIELLDEEITARLQKAV